MPWQGLQKMPGPRITGRNAILHRQKRLLLGERQDRLFQTFADHSLCLEAFHILTGLARRCPLLHWMDPCLSYNVILITQFRSLPHWLQSVSAHPVAILQLSVYRGWDKCSKCSFRSFPAGLNMHSCLLIRLVNFGTFIPVRSPIICLGSWHLASK